MRKMKRRIALVLSVILTLNAVLFGTAIPVSADPVLASVSFTYDNTSLTYGEVQWKDGEESWHTQSEPGIVSATHLRIRYSNNGKIADYTALRFGGVDILGDNKSALESDAGLALTPGGNYEFEHVDFISNSPGPQGPATGVITLNCQDLEEGGFVTYKFGLEAGFVNAVGTAIPIPAEATTVTIKIDVNNPQVYMLDTGRGVSLNVDGVEKYHLSGQDAEGVTEYTFNLTTLAGDRSVAESSFELSYGFQYVDPSMDTRPRNMLWVYSEEYGQEHHFVDPQGDVDCLVLNGDIDILAIQYNNVTYGKADLLELGGREESQRGDVWYEVDPGKMGYAQIPSSAVVTVKLLPDYGYQVLRAELNGSEIAPTEEQSVFKFTMPMNPLHLSAVFTACSDEVVSSADGISSGTILLSANEMDAGSALLTVEDAGNEQVFDGAMDELDGYEIASCLDIGLQQVFYKGTRDDYWANSKDTLADKATISLNLDDAIGTDDIKILHEKHNGEVEIIDATVVNGVVTFETDSFSTYAIVRAKKDTPAVVPTSDTSQSSSNVSMAVTGIGTYPGGMGVNSWEELETSLAAGTAVSSDKPAEMVLNGSATTVPQDVFTSLQNSEIGSIHFHVGNGTAVNFANNASLAGQGAVDLKCTVTEKEGCKSIAFTSYALLSDTVSLHSNVPAGTESVDVYYTDQDGFRGFVGTFIPNDQGRFCFAISRLGLYEIEYGGYASREGAHNTRIAVDNINELSSMLTTNKNLSESVPVEIRLSENTLVPADIFNDLMESDAGSVHFQLGNGTAVNFANNGSLRAQGAVDLKCAISDGAGDKTIAFDSFSPLSAMTSIHSVVSKGTKSVKVYYTDTNKNRTLVGTYTPNDLGRFMFVIDRLGIYEIEY